MPDGGTLTLSTANVDRGQSSGRVSPVDLPPGAYVALSVRDTGVGMDRATQSRVFEPFFTTKDTGSGTGLGLASVYGTVRNHKGAITIDSELGKGSLFTLYLQTTRPGESARADTDEPPSLRLRGHVLVVEDERALREAGRSMLEALGCTVTAAADGKTALELFRDQRESIDVVLLDIMLPGMTGHETLAAMQSIDPRVQVLVMSGYSLDGGAQAMLDAGAKDFLQKPFTMAELAGKIGAVLTSRSRIDAASASRS
jgi:two-component system cell cycle sensor histidine kinase/response regulator CckA